MKKELKSGILSADKSADHRPINRPTVNRPSAGLMLCLDNIKEYSRPIGFLYFYRPINIILSADWSHYIKDITR